MSCDLRVACCARGEEHKHRIVSAGSVLLTSESSGEQAVFVVKTVPAVTVTADDDFICKRMRFLVRKIDLMSGVTVSSAKDSRNACRLKSVFKVVIDKKICCRNCNSSDLVQTEDCKPELIVTLEDEHYSVALFNAERLEVVSRLSRMFLNILKGEKSFVLVPVNVNEGTLVGRFSCDIVNDIKGEVKFVCVIEVNRNEVSVFVLGGINEFFADIAALCLDALDSSFMDDVRDRLVARHNHCKEEAVPAVHGNHTVRG